MNDICMIFFNDWTWKRWHFNTDDCMGRFYCKRLLIRYLPKFYMCKGTQELSFLCKLIFHIFTHLSWQNHYCDPSTPKKKIKRVVDACIMSINIYIHSNSNIIQWQAYKSKNKSTRKSADSAIPTLMLRF